MNRVFKILVFLTGLLFTYLLIVVITTPSASKIKNCITTKMYHVALCDKSEKYSRLSDISSDMKNTIVIAEDASFFSHHGFDEAELKNSVSANFSAKKIARGGSTITQQLAKNVYLTFEKSISRKIREALIARQLEELLTKNEILEKYLNVIEFGPSIYGVKSAAQHYFNKLPSDLNLLESAFLVYLVPNPKVHSRTFKTGTLTAYARYRILDLCYRMYRFGKISNEQYAAAKEIVDEFPWQNLTAGQQSALSGIIYGTDVPQISNDEALPIPEEDITLKPVEPPSENSDSDFEP